MTPSERDRRIEAAVDALMADSGLSRFGGHRVTVERRQRLAFDAADEAVADHEADAYEFWAAEARSEARRAERAEAAARDLIATGGWAIQCLRDVIARKPVRGLDEALSGWEHARVSFSGEEGTEA